MATIFGKRDNKTEKENRSFWVCPNCKAENEIGAPFCLRCAQSEEKELEGKEKEVENPLFTPLLKALEWYAEVAQVKTADVLAEARLQGVYVKSLEELQ